jgi:hypothetical protein
MGSVNEKLAAPDMARQLGLIVAINSIAVPDGDKEHLRLVREWTISQIQGVIGRLAGHGPSSSTASRADRAPPWRS